MADVNIDTAHLDPGKPWQNATNESFNDKLREECLSLEWFGNRTPVPHASSDTVTVTPAAGASRLPLSSTARHTIVRVPDPSGFHS